MYGHTFNQIYDDIHQLHKRIMGKSKIGIYDVFSTQADIMIKMTYEIARCDDKIEELNKTVSDMKYKVDALEHYIKELEAVVFKQKQMDSRLLNIENKLHQSVIIR